MVDTFVVLWAFSLGLVSFFAPCNIAMVPAYVGFFLGRRPSSSSSSSSSSPSSPLPASPPSPPSTQRQGALGALLVAAGIALTGWGITELWQLRSSQGPPTSLGPGLTLAGVAALLTGTWQLAPQRARGASQIGLTVAAGILAVFVLIGIPLVGLFQLLTPDALLIIVLITALLLVIVGLMGLAGRAVSITLPVPGAKGAGPRAFLVFGAGYGLVSLGCNLPLFVAVAVAPLVTGADVGTGILAFTAYGAGMAVLMLALTLLLATARTAVTSALQRSAATIQRAAYALLVLTGVYIAWYTWVVLGAHRLVG